MALEGAKEHRLNANPYRSNDRSRSKIGPRSPLCHTYRWEAIILLSVLVPWLLVLLSRITVVSKGAFLIGLSTPLILAVFLRGSFMKRLLLVAVAAVAVVIGLVIGVLVDAMIFGFDNVQ